MTEALDNRFYFKFMQLKIGLFPGSAQLIAMATFVLLYFAGIYRAI